MDMNSIVTALDAEIQKLKEARALLAQDVNINAVSNKSTAKPAGRRKMSKAARAKIAAAMRKRWAAAKKARK